MPVCPVQPEAFLTVLVFVWGACVGSFLNVCIYRIPAGMSVVTPRSHCPRCRAMIAWYDNIPLFSFLWLGARCRHCKTSITARYFGVELLTAVLFLAVWLKVGFGSGAPPLGLAPVNALRLIPIYWLVVSGLVLATFVDLDHMIIPDRISLGGIVAGIGLSALVPALHGAETVWPALLRAGAGAAIGFLSLWAIAWFGRLLFKKEAMGFGDVKLMSALGAFFGGYAVFFILLMSSLVGSVIGVVLIALQRKRLRARIPFGPFLALAAVLWILWGPVWWEWYVNLLLPPEMTTF